MFYLSIKRVGETDTFKMQGLARIVLLFRNEFNNTGA